MIGAVNVSSLVGAVGLESQAETVSTRATAANRMRAIFMAGLVGGLVWKIVVDINVVQSRSCIPHPGCTTSLLSGHTFSADTCLPITRAHFRRSAKMGAMWRRPPLPHHNTLHSQYRTAV